MDPKELIRQTNEAAAREGHDAAKIAEEAGYDPANLPPVSEKAAAFFAQLETDFGSFTYRHRFPNGQELVFVFPCSITQLQGLSEGGPKYAASEDVPDWAVSLGEDIISTAWIMGETNVEPGLETPDFLRMGFTAGRALFNVAPEFVKAFQKAMALQPAEDIKQGKEG